MRGGNKNYKMPKMGKMRLERIQKYRPRHPLNKTHPKVKLEGRNWCRSATLVSPREHGGSFEGVATFDDAKVQEYIFAHDR